jgi:hypothetical protein
MRRWMGSLCLLGAVGAYAADGGAGEEGVRNPYATHSDQELTDAAADWETLSEAERRALLTEMRGRMDAKHDDGGEGVVAIRTQRRYGRLVRQPDGSVVRVETTERIVRYRRLPEAAAADQPFGVGFERRAGEAGASEDERTVPVSPVRVEQRPR